MFEWFRRRSRKGKPAAVLGQRETIVEANRYDLADLAPNTVSYLGQVAYFELAVFETLSRAVSESPTLASKEGLSAVAGDALAKHHGIVAELRKLKVDPALAMEPFAASIDQIINGLLPSIRMFLPGNLFDPPRAGISARILIEK